MIDQKLIAAIADRVVEELAGKNFDGSPNAGLISAMSQPTAREKIVAALTQSEFTNAEDLKT